MFRGRTSAATCSRVTKVTANDASFTGARPASFSRTGRSRSRPGTCSCGWRRNLGAPTRSARSGGCPARRWGILASGRPRRGWSLSQEANREAPRRARWVYHEPLVGVGRRSLTVRPLLSGASLERLPTRRMRATTERRCPPQQNPSSGSAGPPQWLTRLLTTTTTWAELWGWYVVAALIPWVIVAAMVGVRSMDGRRAVHRGGRCHGQLLGAREAPVLYPGASLHAACTRAGVSVGVVTGAEEEAAAEAAEAEAEADPGTCTPHGAGVRLH